VEYLFTKVFPCEGCGGIGSIFHLWCKNTAFSYKGLLSAAQPPGQAYSHDGSGEYGQPVIGLFGLGLQYNKNGA
jgi:hypothetical protein